MAGTVEQKLTAQGIVLTEPRTPMANYVGFVRTGNLLFVSGQVCANA
jgi:enamine deaminase RidA (YjgF/YER057c/UK114 family)